MYETVIGSGAPVYYDYINSYNAAQLPSTMHAANTGLTRFFTRYLLQKAMSVFKWNMPEKWAKDYALYSLYCWGYFAVINTDRFGVIPQACTLRGYDIFYRPTEAVISNPLLKGIITPRIGQQTELVRLQPDYGGIMDIVSYYAELMALCSETASVNVLASKLSYVFGAENKAAAEALKKMFDQIASGQPAVFLDKQLFRDDGQAAWFTFSQNLKENYIASDVLSDMRKIETMFDTEIGIPNANTDKRERLITDEVNANNFETKSKAAQWLEQLKECCEKVNTMFDINLSVDWREEAADNGDTEPAGAL